MRSSKEYTLYIGKIKHYGDMVLVDTSDGVWEGYMCIMGRGDSKISASYPPPETEEALFSLEEGQKVEVIVRVL